MTRYCLVGDDDGHTYVIPADRLSDWHEFMAIDPEDERAWDVPTWARRLNSNDLTFTDPQGSFC